MSLSCNFLKNKKTLKNKKKNFVSGNTLKNSRENSIER